MFHNSLSEIHWLLCMMHRVRDRRMAGLKGYPPVRRSAGPHVQPGKRHCTPDNLPHSSGDSSQLPV